MKLNFNTKIFLVTILFILAVFTLPQDIFAAEQSNGEYTYQVKNDDTISITGYTGSKTEITIPTTIDNKKITNIEEWAFEGKETITKIIIPEGITKIGNYAFQNCSNLTTVILPDSLEVIGQNSFAECSSLQAIEFGENIKQIGNYAFQFCTSIKNITIPNQIESFDYAFTNSGLTTVIIQDGIQTIGEGTFIGCKSLKNVTLPKSIINIRDNAFQECSILEQIHLPQNLQTIGNSAFYNCKALKEINLPNTLTEIKLCAFDSCSSLKEVIWPKKVNTIEMMTFASCTSLNKITIPDNVTLIEEDVFYNCTNLTTIYGEVGSYAEQFAKEKGYSFSKNSININECIIDGIEKKQYTSKPITQNIVVKNGNTILQQGTDYTVTYQNNTAIGTATITINGIGNYTGSIKKYFNIYCSHKYTQKVIAPTFSTQGYTLHTCSICNSSYKDKYTAKLTKPTKIGGVKGSSPSTSKIKVNWNKIKGVTGYQVYQYNSKKKKYVKIKTTTSNNYTVSKLKAGSTYKFKIRAYKKIGKTTYYGSYSSVLTTATKPSTPRISKISSKNKKTNIQWKKVSGINGYEILMSTSQKGKYSRIKTIKSSKTIKYTKSKLKKKKTYYFKVRAYKNVNGKKVCSSYSGIKSIKIK